MNRCLPMVCALFMLPLALAQDLGNGPVPGPQSIHAEPDGKCRVVHPGDVVHYALTIQSVEYAKSVYADLQMRPGRAVQTNFNDLPIPDLRNIGGGGAATRDPQLGSVYHFSFTITPSVLSGIYHGTGVYVSVSDSNDIPGRSRRVEVNRHTREQIAKYCLNVLSPLGSTDRPLVTDFKPGSIDKTR